MWKPSTWGVTAAIGLALGGPGCRWGRAVREGASAGEVGEREKRKVVGLVATG